jgi:hypothetical protein
LILHFSPRLTQPKNLPTGSFFPLVLKGFFLPSSISDKVIVDPDTFMLQQPGFGFDPSRSSKTMQAIVPANDPMAWDEDQEGVHGECKPHSPGSLRFPYPAGYLSISLSGTIGNS